MRLNYAAFRDCLSSIDWDLTINLFTKFQVSKFTHHKDTKCRNWVIWVARDPKIISNIA